MGTLIKRKESFPLMAKKTVNKFFDDFITKDFDWSDKKFSEFGSENLKDAVNDIEAELAATEIKTENFNVEFYIDVLKNSSEDEARKRDNLFRKEFNYRSFCRLPTL